MIHSIAQCHSPQDNSKIHFKKKQISAQTFWGPGECEWRKVVQIYMAFETLPIVELLGCTFEAAHRVEVMLRGCPA